MLREEIILRLFLLIFTLFSCWHAWLPKTPFAAVFYQQTTVCRYWA